MERPDANGFINIKWPSRTIPHGGVFHTKVLEPSEERQQFLKVLLEESKLSIAQRKKDAWGLRQETEKNERNRKISQTAVTMVRPQTSRRRSLSEIRDSGALDVEKYRPLSRGEDRELMKQRLQEVMAWGDEKPKPTLPKQLQAKTKITTLPTAKDTRNEILTQIRERIEWLADMEVLGEAERHRELIKDQIVERMRSLEALDVDSECSSIAGSGFSTTRSTERQPSDRNTKQSSAKSSKTVASKTSSVKSKQETMRKPRKQSTMQDENVSDYGHANLQYSPRRRC